MTIEFNQVVPHCSIALHMPPIGWGFECGVMSFIELYKIIF